MRLTPLLPLMVLAATLAGCRTPQETARDRLRQEVEARHAARQRSDAAVARGLAALEAGKAEEAEERLVGAVRTDARNPDAWMALGALRYRAGAWREAAIAFERASRLAPTRYEPRYNLGSVFDAAGAYGRAVEEYEAALRLAPDRIEVMENLARVYVHLGENLPRAAELIRRAKASELRPHWRAWLEMQDEVLRERLAPVEPSEGIADE